MNIVKTTRYGHMMFPARDQIVGRSLSMFGEFSELEIGVLAQLVRAGDTVVDVGANIGAHTVPFSRMVGREGLVHAFEPQPFIFYTLCGNVAINSLYNVIPHNAAVGAENGQLAVPELDYDGEANFGGYEAMSPARTRRQFRVPMVKLDNLNLTKCNLIKSDVEGMEHQVLSGAQETIKKCRPILYIEDDRPANSERLRKLIFELGYDLWVHRAPLFNPANVYRNVDNVFGNMASQNLLCVPRGTTIPFDPIALGMLTHDQCRAMQAPRETASNSETREVLSKS